MRQVTSGYQLKCPNCKTSFTICASCYRGHRYCNSSCSVRARYKSLTRSKRKNAKSEHSKKLHRRRQNRYRKKNLASKKVTEHPSAPTRHVLKRLSQFFEFPKPAIKAQQVIGQCGWCKSKVTHLVSLEDAILKRRPHGHKSRT